LITDDIARFARPSGTSASRSRWQRHAVRLGASVVLHLLPLLVLTSALPPKTRPVTGAFGQAVSITLVKGGPALAVASSTPMPAQASFSALEPPRQSSAPATRLSDLFNAQSGANGAVVASIPALTAGSRDDAFGRASVSYRGQDAIRAARLTAKARSCLPGAGPARLLLIIDAHGRMVGRPRLLDSRVPITSAQQMLDALERCGPFSDVATDGAPRSYEVEIG
jgi:hypothetical protein